MKAIRQYGYGSPSTVLRYEDTDRPTIGSADVLVQVRAASLNARDWHLMRGDPYIARPTMPGMGLRGPKGRILGTDFAGRVVAVGAAVSDLRIGDDVYGEADGAFAGYIAVSRDLVGAMPANLTHEQAAAVPLAGNTARECLREAGLQPGQRLLINGASGGVGTFAVQIAHALEAEVTAVCSARNADLVRDLGADHVIDYRKQAVAGTYEVVFDLVGNLGLSRLRRLLTPRGTLILSGGGVSTGGRLIGPMALFVRGMLAAKLSRTHRIIAPQPKPSRAKLDALSTLLAAGTVVPAIDRTYPLSEAPEAIRYLEEDHARAKVVLTCGG